MLQQLDAVLFDADDTLFHFDSFAGLQRLFAGYDIVFSLQDYDQYQAINRPLWVDYQNGAISALQLQRERFSGWGRRLNVSPDTLNDGFLEAMAEICAPLEGAASLLDSLKGKVRLGIITNGFTALQQIRLERTGFMHYFDTLVISEQVGNPKPHPAIFAHALATLNNPPAQRVLMVGDTPESDILGGINAGMQTCWLDHGVRPLPENIVPDWRITHLSQLEARLAGCGEP